MSSQRALMKVMGITFVLIGIFFFVIGFIMLQMMGMLSGFAAIAGAASAGGGQFGTILALGWIFSIVTFAAGVLSIISAIMLFVTKD